MNLVGKPLVLTGILMLATFVGAVAGLYWDVPGRIQSARPNEAQATAVQYSCAMHPEVVSAQPGKCPKCGMALTLATEIPSAHAACGAGGQAASHGCCANPSAPALNLPPGHPPIPGYTTHAGCAHATEAAPSAEKSSK